MLPIALKAVQLQLQAMGAGLYELGVRIPPEKSEDGKSQMILRNSLTNGEVFDKLDWLAAENAKGRLLDQYLESQRSIQTRIGYQKHPHPEYELLDYAHFANKYSVHGERHKADLTYATYSLQRGVSEVEIRDTIRTHASTSAFVNRSQRDQDAYIERTVRKALKQNGFSIPIQPSFHTAELCR